LRFLRVFLIQRLLIQAIDDFDEPVGDRLLAEGKGLVEMAQTLA